MSINKAIIYINEQYAKFQVTASPQQTFPIQ